MDILRKNEIDLIVSSVTGFYQVDINDIDKRLNKDKRVLIIWPRQVLEYYLYKKCKIQHSEIIKITGTTRGTIFNSVKAVNNEIETKTKKGLMVLELVNKIDVIMSLFKQGMNISVYMTEKYLNIKTLINSIEEQISEFEQLRLKYLEFKNKCESIL